MTQLEREQAQLSGVCFTPGEISKKQQPLKEERKADKVPEDRAACCGGCFPAADPGMKGHGPHWCGVPELPRKQ